MASEFEFTFLVTTDNHMGFKQDDHLRRKDSYMAFAEALRISRENDVDFVLLGGDLFHMNRPSASIEHKCIKIIRQHMNAATNRKTSFERIGGNFSHFQKLSHPNFEDKNLTVPYPIMTIHGNHDDPTGPNAQSVCEKLATCGLLNYFGLPTAANTAITIEPIILLKGNVKIALYGLGFIPDYKLKIAFDKKEVSFVDPPKDSFNILVVHQNRVPFLKSKCIPDEVFPDFFHLIIRGHEHNTQAPEPISNSSVNGIVYQPGSTVATSISVMEAGAKRVGLMKVRLVDPRGTPKTRYKLDYKLIELQCCRRMIFKDIKQREIKDYIKSVGGAKRITSEEYKQHSRDYVEQVLRNLLASDKSQHLTQESQNSSEAKLYRFDLPLARLRLEYVSKNERFDELDISSRFYPKEVANRDIILFKKQKLVESGDGEMENITFSTDSQEDDDLDEFDHINLGNEKRDTIDVMIESYFMYKPASERLQALSITEYTRAVKAAQEDGNIISKVLNKKKREVLYQYLASLTSEEVAKDQFHDGDKVREWLLVAFGNNGSNLLNDEEDMDIMVCD